jgi:hypothetical protein
MLQKKNVVFFCTTIIGVEDREREREKEKEMKRKS